jgi:hypothetical protein
MIGPILRNRVQDSLINGAPAGGISQAKGGYSNPPMKTQNIAALVLAGGLFATVAFAENSAAAPVVTSMPEPAPNQIVYATQLPAVPELTRAAAAQSLTIKQIVQSPRDLTLTYQSADGQTKVVAYRLLSDAGAGVVQPPAPTVVYAAPPYPSYYYDPFYPDYWYPPFSVRFGFGFRSGGFRGGFRGGHR